MRCLSLSCAMALALLALTTSAKAAEVNWGVVNVESNDGRRIAYYATNGKAAPFAADSGEVSLQRQGTFRIGCLDESRHIYLTAGTAKQAVVSIPESGFADIDLNNGKPPIELKGRLIMVKETNAVNFSAVGLDRDQFVLIANRLMSGTDKLGFRIRAGSPERPGLTFRGEIAVGKKAPAAVADALQNCGFI